MAIINGTAAGDFIHRNGDGILNPGLNEINTVTTGADTISGLAGNDFIFGDDGGDTINGDDGNDILHGGQSVDILNGGVGNDIFRIIQVSDVSGLGESINGGNDIDTIDFGAFSALGAVNLSTAFITGVEQLSLFNNDVTMTTAQLGAFTGIFGTGLLERIFLTDGGLADLTGAAISVIEEIRGNALVNTVNLTGVATGQFVNALAGNDVVTGGDGGDTLDGGAGLDNLSGGQGNDLLLGGADNDTLTGGDGNDIMAGGAGLDNQSGGIGNDTFRILLVSDISGLAENLNGGVDIDTLDFQVAAATGPVNLSTAILTSIETLQTNGNDITLTGAQLGNFTSIFGTGLTERLIMSAAGVADLTGANIIGIDEFRGSIGNDNINLTDVAIAQFVDGKAGNDFIRGSLANDTIFGDLGGDTILANEGNDVIRGGQSADNLQGGTGNDTFQITGVSDISGLAESVNGGADVDTLDFQAFGALGTVNLSLAIISGVENLHLAGNTATLTAAQMGAFETIAGTGLTERLILSAAGAVNLSNATVSNIDEIRGTAGNDVFNLTNAAGTGTTLNGLAGNDNIAGGGVNDAINGGDGDDVLNGGGGGDVITGGLGRDTMTGGLGAEIFDFNDRPESAGGALRDVITDFVHGQDVLNLADIDANILAGGDQAFIYIGAAAFGGVTGQLRYAGGLLQADVDGNNTSDFEIFLTGAPVLTNPADFVL